MIGTRADSAVVKDDPNLDDILNESDSSDDVTSTPQSSRKLEEVKRPMTQSQTPTTEESKTKVLVDPSAVIFPTPKSEGAAQFGKPQSEEAVAGLPGVSEDDDLDSFSDINSQDDALTRERKENKFGLRKGIKTLATNLAGKANLLIQTTGSAMASLSKIKSSPPGANDADLEDVKDPSDVEAMTPSGLNDDPDKMSEDEKRRIMKMIEQEDSSDEDDDSDQVDQTSEGRQAVNKPVGSDNDSFCSDNDILNRSLNSDCGDAILPENYLRYASEKYSAKLDILGIIDKNERSFKQVAEKMIQQSSQLETHTEVREATLQRKLMHQKTFKKIADRYHGDV